MKPRCTSAAQPATLSGVASKSPARSKTSSNTRLLYCTNGILLRRLQVDPSLIGVSHIVLDEVHERNIESDFLLIVLRDLLKIRTDLRIVLMSATLNADTFATYFNNSVLPKA
mgnify:CR=1 FL=1